MTTEIVFRMCGLEFHADDATDEPRALDIDVGRLFGLARPRDVRRVIRKHVADGTFQKVRHLRERVVRADVITPTGGVSERYETQYLLTRKGTLKLATKLRTSEADSMTEHMIDVFDAAIELLRAPSPAPAQVSAAAPSPITVEDWLSRLPPSTKVGDHAMWSDEMAGRIRYAALRQGVSWRFMEGSLRRLFGVVSYKRILIVSLQMARNFLDALTFGDTVLARKVSMKALPPDTRQQVLFKDYGSN